MRMPVLADIRKTQQELTLALAELDRHVKNLTVIVPNDKAEKDDGDHGIAGSVELSQPAPTES